MVSKPRIAIVGSTAGETPEVPPGIANIVMPSMDDAVDGAVRAFGGLHGLVNCAGVVIGERVAALRTAALALAEGVETELHLGDRGILVRLHALQADDLALRERQLGAVLEDEVDGIDQRLSAPAAAHPAGRPAAATTHASASPHATHPSTAAHTPELGVGGGRHGKEHERDERRDDRKAGDRHDR